jgi:hypothetical protein
VTEVCKTSIPQFKSGCCLYIKNLQFYWGFLITIVVRNSKKAKGKSYRTTQYAQSKISFAEAIETKIVEDGSASIGELLANVPCGSA